MSEKITKISHRTEAETAIAESIRKVIVEKYPELKNTTIDFDLAKVVIENDPLRNHIGGDIEENFLSSQEKNFIKNIRETNGKMIPRFPHKEDGNLAEIIFHSDNAAYLAKEELEDAMFGDNYDLWPSFGDVYSDEYDTSIMFTDMDPNFVPTKEQLKTLSDHGFLYLHIKSVGDEHGQYKSYSTYTDETALENKK